MKKKKEFEPDQFLHESKVKTVLLVNSDADVDFLSLDWSCSWRWRFHIVHF